MLVIISQLKRRYTTPVNESKSKILSVIFFFVFTEFFFKKIELFLDV